MQKHGKKIVIAIVVIAVVVFGGSFIYAKVINTAPDQTSGQDAIAATQRNDQTSSTSGVDGNWTIGDGSFVRYRVTESINGFDTEGVGESKSISGTLDIAGTRATAATFTVDMTTFSSDESRRDGQFNGRIMSVDDFPTATFLLTAPIEFDAIPSPGEAVTATAVGDLTLRGVTKSVTFDVSAAYGNDVIGIQGSIPVLFSDFGIRFAAGHWSCFLSCF